MHKDMEKKKWVHAKSGEIHGLVNYIVPINLILIIHYNYVKMTAEGKLSSGWRDLFVLFLQLPSL